MKKVLSVLLTLTMMATMLACNGNEDEKETTPTTKKTTTEAPVKTEEEESSKATEDASEAPTEDETETPTEPQTEGETEAPTEKETDPVEVKDPVDISVWHLFGETNEAGTPHAYYTDWADRFNEESDYITVSVLGGKSATDIQTAIAASSTPDVFMNFWNNAPQWSENGALLDLTPYYESDEEFDYKDFMPGALAISYYNDKFYSVPNSYSTTYMFYREDILAEAGWDSFPDNTDDLMQVIKDTTVAADDGSIERLGMLPNMPWLDVVMWSAAYDATWIGDDGVTVTANNPENVAMFQFILDIYNFYEEEFGWDALTVNDFGDTVRGNRATASDPVLTGEVAMRWNAEGLHVALAEEGPDVDWKMAWFPNAPGVSPQAMLTSNVWQINANTDHPDEAWEALASLTSKENLKIMAQGEHDNGAFFARRSVIEYMNDTLAEELGSRKEDEALGASVTENLLFISDSMLNAELVAFPCLGYVNEYLASIGTYADMIFQGVMTPEEAMENVVTEIQPLADQKPYSPYEG